MQVYEYRFTRHLIGEAGPNVSLPREAYEAVRPLFTGAETERLVVLLLNTKNRPIGAETVYTGNVSASVVRVGELFRSAVRLNASGIILAHNHPSNDPNPSPDDLHLTAEVVAAGRLLDIAVLDHLVVTDDAYISLRDRGVAFEQR